jgi:copper chaperone CopZ
MKWQRMRIVLVLCCLMAGLSTNTGTAASGFRSTTITINMDNEKCVGRITASLRDVPNVGAVSADVGKKTATVSPAGLRTPSPRALWEAVEKTGHAVVQLQGPQGTFTSKPEN